MNDENYQPYGEEWRKQMMRMKKEDIVTLFANSMRRRDEIKELSDGLIAGAMYRAMQELETWYVAGMKELGSMVDESDKARWRSIITRLAKTLTGRASETMVYKMPMQE